MAPEVPAQADGRAQAPDQAHPDGRPLAQAEADPRERVDPGSQAPVQQTRQKPPGTYPLSGIAGSDQARVGHPDYVSFLAAASAYLGCLPRHLHYSVCIIEQEMADVERALGTGQRP